MSQLNGQKNLCILYMINQRKDPIMDSELYKNYLDIRVFDS